MVQDLCALIWAAGQISQYYCELEYYMGIVAIIKWIFINTLVPLITETAFCNETQRIIPLTQNITVSYDNSATISNDVSNESNVFIWRHNGYAVDLRVDSKVSIGADGSLSIDHVKPSDAGYYEVIISDQFSCDTIYYHIFIECKLKICCY